MSLYTDALNVSVSNLHAYDSTVTEVAATERIDLQDKLQLAQKEVGIEICNFLLRHGIPLRAGSELHNVVRTEQIEHVHCLQTLTLFYRDAHNSQMNERYKGKWREYEKQADLALRRLFETGIGIVLNPVPQAAIPLVSSMPGGVLPARTYSVSLAWAGSSGSAGAPSIPLTVELASGTLMSVAAGIAPAGVTGFIVLAGDTEGRMWQQSVSVTGVTAAWREPVSGLRQDLAPWPEQRADYYVANRRQLLRG